MIPNPLGKRRFIPGITRSGQTNLQTPAGWQVKDDGSGNLIVVGPASYSSPTFNFQNNGGFSATGTSAGGVGFACLGYVTPANLNSVDILGVGIGVAPVIAINGGYGFGATQATVLFDPVSNTAFLSASNQNINIFGRFSKYNNITTDSNGLGVVPIYKVARQKAETGADVNVLTYIPPASVGFYRISVNIDCSIWAANMSCTLAYKDSNGAAVSKALYFTDLTTGANLTVIAATGNYGVIFPFDIDNSATNIVIAVTGAVGNTYKISAAVEQLA